MRYTAYIILTLLLLPALVSYAQDIPVLPLPVHVEKIAGQEMQFSSAYSLHYNGVDDADKAGLQEHWDHFTKTYAVSNLGKVQQIEFVLLGKDKNFDKLIAESLAQWSNKIGNEGYLLIFTENRRILAANTATGLFYALQTLKQLIRAHWKQALLIADYPSFEHRAIYDDISRGPISTPAYIKQQIERLSELKINELSFYIEHVVQPVSYPDFAPANGKLTIPEIKELSAYANKYHMQLVGSFQSFGHFDKILSLPQYKSMGETSTLISPLDPGARKFLTAVIGELCDAFSSPYFNVNCDETFDLGKGKSKAYVDSIGPARFYADHIKFLYDIVKQHHKILMMWGDIALSHEEILDMLPRDIVYLTWEYGSQASFDKWIAPFQKRGLSFMVCPGILNSYRLMPDMVMATANIDGFLPEGKEKNALGVITTVWDDGGAYLFSGDWYGVYKAADKSWNTAATNKTSFDKRYTITAYGTNDQSYVHALDAMMGLRKLPLTYNLNDNIWNQKLMPGSGRRLILDNSDVDTALQIINHAKKYIDAAKPVLHAGDIQTLKLNIEQFRLIMDGRRQMPLIAGEYKKAMDAGRSNPAKSAALLNGAAASVNILKNRYEAMQKEFRGAWLRENQAYFLDTASKPYITRIQDLTVLYDELQQASKSVHLRKGLPASRLMRLDIVQNDQYYFQNWMLCGPFAAESGNAPAFLYSGDAPKEQAPKPGDLISYRNKNFRWQKYASPNGGITELDDFYHAGTEQIAYAFCTLTTENPQTVAAFANAANGLQVFCNATSVLADNQSGKEEKMILSLKAGINYILLKIPAGSGPWSFSFRLDPKLNVTNQKYKYFINTQKGNHEAE